MSHSYYNNYVHAVYSTKDRENLIPPEFAAPVIELGGAGDAVISGTFAHH